MALDRAARERAPARAGAALRRGGASTASASATVAAFAHSRPNSAQNTRAHVSASASARCVVSTSMPSASASAASRRWRTSGAKRRASATVHSAGGSGHAQVGARERLAQDAAVERRVVGDEHARGRRADQLGEVGQDRVGGRRRVDHLLGDLREALDRARQRRGAADERLPAVVQLAAADEHRADLGQLAGLARAAVGLGVDDEELGGRERLGEQVHERMFSRRGRTAARAVAASADRSRG